MYKSITKSTKIKFKKIFHLNLSFKFQLGLFIYMCYIYIKNIALSYQVASMYHKIHYVSISIKNISYHCIISSMVNFYWKINHHGEQ